MKSRLYNIFNDDFKRSQFLRLKENEGLHLYIGKDSNGHYAFEFRGHYSPVRLVGSEVILVTQTKQRNILSLCFSLENPDLLEYFCTFCEDLVNSTLEIVDDNIAYKLLCSRYLSWKKLFKPNQARLNEQEVMGLIGELLFLRDFMFTKYGFDISLDSWTGPEYTRKDFSLKETWHEVKTISAGKGTVKISSIEQLDSDVIGTLCIYQVEKMSPSYNGIKLNAIVTDILAILPHNVQKELFLSKLSDFGYDFSTEYDNFVFSLINHSHYTVDTGFPRLSRDSIASSIQKAQYDIIIADLEPYRLTNLNL